VSLPLYSTKGCYSNPVPEGFRRLAWEGVSFCVPSNWELADYRYQRRRACRIEVEDDVAVRIESEWVRTTDRFNLESIMERYEKASKPLTMKAEEKIPVPDLPRGWHATRFTFKETGAAINSELQIIRHELVTVFYLCPENTLFCFFLLHFLPENKEDPTELTQSLTRSFQDHRDQPHVPWELFDISYCIPKGFMLTRTSVDIGSKMMVFEWEKRRLFVWSHSCADVFLKTEKSMEHWIVGNLNAAKKVKGITFRLNKDGTIGWRRNPLHPLGMREEIWRWCFRYEIVCKLVTDRNQIVVMIYHHRSSDDLHMMPKL
jgi:hypothetical protein